MNDDLIRAAMRRDEQACHELFNLWFAKAYRVGKSVCGSGTLAEDAVQEALIRFWNALPRLKDTAAAEGYFLRIVANEARRIHARRRASPEEYLQNLPEAGASMMVEENGREQFAELLRAVNALPEKLRDTLKLHYYGGFTEAETAEILGVSLSSVKMRLMRGREKLRSMLNDSGTEATGGY